MTTFAVNGGSATCKTVLASTIAKDLMIEVSKDLSATRKAPLLVGFLANTDPAARRYAEWTDRTCQDKYALDPYGIAFVMLCARIVTLKCLLICDI